MEPKQHIYVLKNGLLIYYYKFTLTLVVKTPKCVIKSVLQVKRRVAQWVSHKGAI